MKDHCVTCHQQRVSKASSASAWRMQSEYEGSCETRERGRTLGTGERYNRVVGEEETMIKWEFSVTSRSSDVAIGPGQKIRGTQGTIWRGMSAQSQDLMSYMSWSERNSCLYPVGRV